MKINILGTEYEIIETTDRKDPRLENAAGWCGTYEKIILIESDIFLHEQGGDIDNSRIEHSKFVKRHELLHAYFNESGLDGYSGNEQLVTWIARLIPKIIESMKQVDAI